MIKQEQVMPRILEACPSFQETWDKSDDQDLLYVVMGELAHHLLLLYRDKRTDEFGPLCEIIERLHTDGDSFVRELATIGILEGVQNVWSNNDANPEDFCKFLLPKSRKWWKELNDFWEGKIPHVGAGLHNKALQQTPPSGPVSFNVIWKKMNILKRIKNVFQKKPVWYEPEDPSPREQCPCCDYISLPERGNYLICPICFWEDDGQDIDELDERSGPNHGITLREGRQNFQEYGACEKEMVKNVLPVEERKNFKYKQRNINDL